MSIIMKAEAVTSGGTFTWPDDATQSGDTTYLGLEKYEKHFIQVSGAGSGIITADSGNGDKSIATLSDDYDTYLIPLAVNIKIEASGGDIDISMKSYSDKTDC